MTDKITAGPLGSPAISPPPVSSEPFHKKSWVEKYGNATKMLLPCRCSAPKTKDTLNNNDVGCFSYITVNWMSKLMWTASRKGVQPAELKRVGKPDEVGVNYERLQRLWDAELQKYGPDKASLHKVIWRFNRFRLILAGIMMTFTCIFAFLGPSWVLEYILKFLEEPEQPLWFGICLVIALSLSQLLKNMAYSAMWVMGTNAGVKIQGALQMLIYEKILRIRNGGDNLIAEAVNHCTSDMDRIFQSMHVSMLAIGAPVMLILNVAYCYLLMGPWSLLGNVIILFYYPAMMLVARLTSRLRVKAIRLTDKRIGLMNQVLGNIKLIKTYAWEEKFSDNVKGIREEEESILRSSVFLQSMSWTTAPVVSMIAPMASIFGYVLMGNNITAPQAFSLMSVYSALLLPLNTLPIAVKGFSEGAVCCRRIQKLLLSTDVPPSGGQETSESTGSYAVMAVNADIGWYETASDTKGTSKTKRKVQKKTSKKSVGQVYSSQDPLYEDGIAASSSSSSSLDSIHPDPNMNKYDSKMDMNTIFHGLNLVVEKGKLVGICGSVGSGKSTLLSGIIGSASVSRGRISVQGTIALVTQQAWIFNGTVRENIIFGLPYDEQRYKFVVHACSLQTDFALMPNGDQTEIGERGANLSGGQKQRISLARSVYSDRDVYILDDALSAVDVKVSNHIFHNCIKTALASKTVFLVTHAVHLLEHCDYILVINDGEIAEQGTHQNLLKEEGEYFQLVVSNKNQRMETDRNKNASKASTKKRLISDAHDEPIGDGKMIQQEVDLSSSLTWKTWLYFCKMCGGYILSLLTLFTIILFNLTIMFNTIWLQIWLEAGSGSKTNGTDSNATSSGTLYDAGFSNVSSSASDYDITQNPRLNMYVIVYGASGIAIILSGILKAFSIGKVMLTGASAIHHTMFWKVIRSPMSFFDTTPLGRIIARFSKDMDELDTYIPYTFDFVLQSIILIVFQLLLIGILYPWYMILVGVAFIAFVVFDIILTSGVGEIKRLDNVLRPPLLGHIVATIQGIDIIRCYEKQKIFAEKFSYLVNKHLSGFLLFQLSPKWLAFRGDTLGWLVVTATGLLITLSRENGGSAATAGNAMVQIFRVCGVISVVMRWKAELSARLVSIERVAHYCKNLPEEAPAVIKDSRPPEGWPFTGSVAFRDVFLRYRPDLPDVLQGLTFDIKGGERVGIIGRTGAGKSSLIGTILRLSEACGGTILIDGVDIQKIGLHDLRSTISVIPQEPVLFEGTIRWNMDPFGKFDDEEIWDSLEKAHLKKKIVREPQKLDCLLHVDGGMFSLGEKQLFCLARALLRRSKILLLDEATASVDIETDKLIQTSIRSSFSHCTVITIAHRLNTISDYDKIMALDAGKVVEFDTPENLMAKDSLFRTMMRTMMENH